MEKSIFEQMGGTYREEDGCLIPNLSLPEREEHTIGKYGQLHLDFLKKHRRGTYTTLPAGRSREDIRSIGIPSATLCTCHGDAF